MIINHTSHGKKLLIILGTITFVGLIVHRLPDSNTTKSTIKPIVIEKPRPPPICGFYHFSTVGAPWKSIIYEQMLLAYISGLVNASSNIYVTGLGNPDDNKTIYDIFDGPKFIYEFGTEINVFEYPILRKTEKYCLQNNNSLVWYAHSKGASHHSDDTYQWRGLMNYFVLKKWRLCYDLLSTTNYTTCGAILTFDSERKAGWNTYYAGNMWWSKCSHINQLTRIEKLDHNDRFMAELYVTSEPDVGHFNCYYADLGQPWNFNMENASCTVNYPLWKVR